MDAGAAPRHAVRAAHRALAVHRGGGPLRRHRRPHQGHPSRLLAGADSLSCLTTIRLPFAVCVGMYRASRASSAGTAGPVLECASVGQACPSVWTLTLVKTRRCCRQIRPWSRPATCVLRSFGRQMKAMCCSLYMAYTGAKPIDRHNRHDRLRRRWPPTRSSSWSGRAQWRLKSIFCQRQVMSMYSDAA